MALEKAMEATRTDPLGARMWTNLAGIQERVGEDATTSYQRAIQLQSTNAVHQLSLAQFLAAKEENDQAGQAFDRAIELDPNGTSAHLARGQWLLQHTDLRGWRDLEFIARLAMQPYGKYPATPDFVNFDFARAYVQLVPRLLAQGKRAHARQLVQCGLADIAHARGYQSQQEEIEKETEGAVDTERAQELDKLETQLKELDKQT